MPATSRFTPATRKKSKLRFALDGPAGSGKTFTLLRFAFALAAQEKGRVAVLDTEHDSAQLYAGESPDGIPFRFDHMNLANHAPTEFTAAIEEAAAAKYDCLVIDSLSHAWNGVDGALEIVGKKTGPSGNNFTAWKDVTPMHTRMVEAILAAPMHIFVSMRSKTEYVLETNEKGKQVPRKVGMAPIQRAGMEYEFTVYGSMDWAHVMTITKSRCSAVSDAVAVKPGALWLRPVIDWLDGGEALPDKPLMSAFVSDAQLEKIVALVKECGKTVEREKGEVFKRYSVEDLSRLSPDQANDYEARLRGQLDKLKKKTPPATAAAATATETTPAATTPSSNTPPPDSTPPATPLAQTLKDSIDAVEAAKKAGDTKATATTQPASGDDMSRAPTQAELEHLSQLRAEWSQLKQFDKNALTTAWKAILAGLGVTTAKELPVAKYRSLCQRLADERAELMKGGLTSTAATAGGGVKSEFPG